MGNESEDNEDAMEREAHLYSQIHYDINPNFILLEKSQAQGSSEEVDVLDCLEEDDDYITHQLKNGVTDALEPDSCDRSEDEEDDDGIQVIASPELAKNCLKRARDNPNRIEEVLSDSSSHSSVLELGRKKGKKTNEDFSSNKKAPRKSANPTKSFVFASASDDEEEDEVSSFESSDSNEISLNVTGRSSRPDFSFIDSVVKEAETPIQGSAMCAPKKWSSQLISFYNSIDYDVLGSNTYHGQDEDTLRKADWKVDRADLYGGSHKSPGYRSDRYYQRKRCVNCNEIGHLLRECRQPLKNSCAICGQRGHLRHSCRSQHCLRCGNPDVNYYSSGCVECRDLNRINCVQCLLPGHTKSNCPDNWRRYHAATNPTVGGLIQLAHNSEKVHKPESENWCSNCGRKGHFLHHCRAFKVSDYPYHVLNVVTYDGQAGNLQLEDLPPGSTSKRKQRKLQMEIKKARKRFASESPRNGLENKRKKKTKNNRFDEADVNKVDFHNDFSSRRGNQDQDITSSREKWKLKRKEKRSNRRKDKKYFDDENLFSLSRINKMCCKNKKEFNVKKGYITKEENHSRRKKIISKRRKIKNVRTFVPMDLTHFEG